MLKINHKRKTRKGDKLSPRYMGPYEVSEITKQNTYQLKKGDKILAQKIHGSHLKLYLDQLDVVSSTSSGSSSNEVRILRVAKKPFTVYKQLTDAFCAGSTIFLFVSGCSRQRVLNNKTAPPLIEKIHGDGNCLFRALAYSITGTEIEHVKMRRDIVNGLRTFENRLIGHFPAHKVSDISAEKYICNSQMNKLGTWGTDLEMLGFSLVFDVGVVTYHTEYRTWLNYDMRDNQNDNLVFLVYGSSHYNAVKI